jgi:threonine aldolase
MTADATAGADGPGAAAGGETGHGSPPTSSARPRGFASDNYAGVLPQVLDAIASANTAHAVSYGGDEWTARVEDIFRQHFGPEASTAIVFNGTGANVVALQALTRPYEACICASTAHLNVDECGAPERVAGLKLLTVDSPDGKLTPALVEPRLVRFGDEHAVQPRVVSITQSTELGTLYTPDEIAALAEQAHERGMLLHIDGARLSNAAAALGVELKAITTDAGADAVSFGGTKNGMLLGEAVVFLRAGLGGEVAFLRKQSMQLASKMRFLAAQFEALLADWRTPAAHSNAMAKRLAEAVSGNDGVQITQRVEANAVFAVLPPAATAWLQERWRFYVWNETTGEVRWMCSWDTTEDDVDTFSADVAEALRVT